MSGIFCAHIKEDAMKLFTGIIIFSFCLILGTTASAEPVGNSADVNFPPGRGIYSADMADYVKIGASFDVDYLLEKKFEASERSSNIEMEGAWYMLKVSCTLFDRFQPYVAAGWSDLEMSWINGAEDITAEGDHDAGAWGFGLKMHIWEYEPIKLKIFASGSYRASNPDIRSVAGKEGLSGKKFDIYEKQAAVGLSSEFPIPGYEEYSIAPYGGVVFSETIARVRFMSGSEIYNAGAEGQQDNIGFFVGADMLFVENLTFNVEARFIDQTAISTGCKVLF